MINRQVLVNAFVPAHELEVPDRFAGRRKQVLELSDCLYAHGATPLIYGDRGLGKSSLALQLQLIAMGNAELLTKLGVTDRVLPPDKRFLTFFVTCTDSTRNFADLLQSLVNHAESVEHVDTSAGATKLIDRTTRKRVTFKLFEAESTKKYAAESGRLSFKDLNLEEKLVQLCELLTDTYGMPVLFIIDELDRMKDTAGLASFLKAVSSEALKFVLVGIASNVAELLTDHQSIERRLRPVLVPVMEEAELEQIVIKAQSYLNAEGIPLAFSMRAIARLADVSSGYPWFVHVLGQECLIVAESKSRTLVQYNDVDRAIRGLARNESAQQLSDMYQAAVRDSEPREKTLRAFALWNHSDIPTRDVYKLLSEELGTQAGSTHRSQLCKAEFGGILFVPPFQKRGLVRFRNEMFKAYVRMRPSIYSGVDSAVKEAYLKRHWRQEREFDEYSGR